MERSLKRLEQILDLLGPGLFLQMDKAAFPQFFGGEIGRETAEVRADRFAREHHCSFASDGDVAIFGRAYSVPTDG